MEDDVPSMYYPATQEPEPDSVDEPKVLYTEDGPLAVYQE